MKRATKVNLLILLVVALLAVLPVALGAGDHKKEPFSGADANAQTTITENDPGYTPWFSSFYKPGSAEIESGLFALQAALGAGLVGYVLGVMSGRRRSEETAVPSSTPATAGPDDGGRRGATADT